MNKLYTTQVRASLKSVGSKSVLGRVLDGRQKALKLMANAMYGFTGAQPSPVRLVALADACLSLGAAVCHCARETLEDEAAALFAKKVMPLQDIYRLSSPCFNGLVPMGSTDASSTLPLSLPTRLLSTPLASVSGCTRVY